MKRKRTPITPSNVLMIAVLTALAAAIVTGFAVYRTVQPPDNVIVYVDPTPVSPTSVPATPVTVAQSLESACKLDSHQISSGSGAGEILSNAAQTTASALSQVFSSNNRQAAQPPVAGLPTAEMQVLAPVAANGGADSALPNVGGAVVQDAAAPQPPQSLNVVGRVEAEAAVEGFTYEEATEVDYDSDDVASDGNETDFFQSYGENPLERAELDNLSTFAMDVDTASFAVARNYLLNYGSLPPANAIRPEEFINYFSTDYATPQGDDAFAIHMDAAPSPFTEDALLMRVGIQGRVVSVEERDPALLIFVVDTSGSMSGPERIGLVKQALGVLVEELSPRDCVGIVEYSSQTRVILPPIPATETATILQAVNMLEAGGSTYAEAGLRLGYDLALEHMQKGANTRVILLSDGVANVGETGPEAILETIRAGVEDGIVLTSIGVGMGDFNDVLLERLANDGNGNYYYIDDMREARRVFVTNLTSTLQVIGYDAKIQVEFNKDTVASYRLIGYENRAIADSDFRNDTVDAGEVGAGHTVTALYEVELLDNAYTGRIATTFIRYENAETRAVEEVNTSFTIDAAYASFDEAPADYRLLAAVAEFSEILRNQGQGNLNAVTAIIEPLTNTDDQDIQVLWQMLQNARAYQQ